MSDKWTRIVAVAGLPCRPQASALAVVLVLRLDEWQPSLLATKLGLTVSADAASSSSAPM